MIFWLAVVIVALFCSAFFAFSETSVFSIPREKYEILKRENGNGKKIYEILLKSNLFLVFLLLGNNFVNIVAISGLEILFGSVFGNNLTLVFVCTTAVILTFGEILPKNIAIGNYMFIARLLAPVIAVILKYSDGFLKKIDSFNLYILRMNYRYLLQTPDPFVTGEEYAMAVKQAVVNKKLSETGADIITSFLDLTQNSVLLTARNRACLKFIEKSGEKKYLEADEIAVLCDDCGDVKTVYYRSPNNNLKKLAPLWFPTSKTVGDLHNYFLQNGSECALLIDEYGDFFGAVSKYDIYRYWKALRRDREEILNEITLKGSDEIVKYNEWISKDTMEKYPEAKTFNGILCSMAGEIPKKGNTISENGFVYLIIDADRTKIKKIRIQKNLIS
jgi:Mg2+/Co2+ transporter CorB